MKYILFLICLFYSALGCSQPITLNVKNASLPDVIRFVAISSGINVIIADIVTGSVSLVLNQVTPESALDTILAANGLDKMKLGNVWYVAPREELIKNKQQQVKWQEVFQQSQSLITSVRKIRYAKAEDIAVMIRNPQASFISKRGTVNVDARTNTLLIQDIRENMEVINHFINRLDVPVRQIMIEARLASVDTDFEREIGLDFTVQNSGDDNNGNVLLNASQNLGKYSIAVARLANGSQLDVKLSALQANGHAELISSPRLFTANQQSAYIESGEEVPYQEVSESGGTAVAFKKAVLGLKVTPQILPGNRVLLQLKINQDRPGARLVQGVPAISTRQMLTNVLVKNGQTVALGGIYETSDEDAEHGLPFLSDIPVLGVLFRTQTTRHNKRELLVFVTPSIID